MNFPKDENNSLSAKTFFIETYGCQMNENDSEIISSILMKANLSLASELSTADVILLNTCAIREKAQEKVFSQLGQWREIKKKNPNKIKNE